MILDKIKEILKDQLDINPDMITMDTDVVEDLKADSLDVVEMLMNVENEFGIIVDDDDVQGLKKIKDVVAYIEAKKK